MRECSACGKLSNNLLGASVVRLDGRPTEFVSPVGDTWFLCESCFTDHFVVFTAESWTVEHSFECRLSGQMVECAYHRAIEKVADEPDPLMVGRWRILEIDSEGLPSLVRA